MNTQDNLPFDTLSGIVSGLSVTPQRQDSTANQLADAKVFADRLGIDLSSFYVDALQHRPDEFYVARERLQTALASFEQQPPVTLPADKGLLLMRQLCNRLGLYDAADVYRNRFEYVTGTR